MKQIHQQDSALSNLEFLDRHAQPGRIGLAGGTAFIDRSIRKMQRSLQPDIGASLWSHAFICSGRRIDGQHWLLESDLEFHRKQIRLGVQENRASKYADAHEYPNLAILDFSLNAEQTRLVLTEGLDLLAGLARYSLREIVGTLFALQRPALRARENLLAREGSLYCSALVQHCYARAGVEFAPGISVKNTTPQDIAATPVAHDAYVLVRENAI
ncbi:MAG: hypothetical protein ABI411_06570 [Tahibacter sp.]